MRPGRRVRAAPPQAALSPGSGRRRGPGTGCGATRSASAWQQMPQSAPCPRRSAPRSHRPPGPVPLPGAPERGQASAAGAGAPRGSRRHGGSEAPALPPPPPPPLPPRRAETSRAPRPPYLRVCAGSGAAGGSWSRAKATASPAESPDRCAPSPPAPHFLSRPLGLEIPGEARCSPGSSQSPRAGPAQPLSAQAAAGGRACPGRWPRLHLMPLSPPSRGHDSGEGARRPAKETRAGLRGTARPAPGAGWCRRSRGGSAGGRALPLGTGGRKGSGDGAGTRGSGRAGAARRRAARFPCLSRGRCSSPAQRGAANTIAFIKQRKCHWEEWEGGRENSSWEGEKSLEEIRKEQRARAARPPGEPGRGAPAAAGRRCQPRVPAAGRGWGVFPARPPGLREAPESPPQASGERGRRWQPREPVAPGNQVK